MDAPSPSHLSCRLGEAALLERLRAALPGILDRAAGMDAADGALPEEDVATLTSAGLLTAPLPTTFGGHGWGSESSSAASILEALRLLGRTSLPLGRLYEGHVSAIGLVMRHGTPSQREAAAEAAHTGCLFGGWGCEAPLVSLRLESGVLRGGKVLCSGAGLVERALVTARCGGEGQQQMVLVSIPKHTHRADLGTWTPTGMRASATGSVNLDEMAVGPELLIGKPDAHRGMAEYAIGMWRPLAVQLGGLEAVAESMRTYLRSTGRGKDPHQAARMGSVLTEVETARLWVREAGLMAESLQACSKRVEAYVNLARGAVERAALEVMQATNRSVGLSSFMRPNPVERQIRDLATYLRQPALDRALISGATTGLDLPEVVGTMWPTLSPL